MAARRLPSRPDLEELKRQAVSLQALHAAGHRDAFQRLRDFHPRFSSASDTEIGAATVSLADALLAIAREHSFHSWARLRSHIIAPDPSAPDCPHHYRIDDPHFRQAVDLLDDGDLEGLRDHLRQYPDLVFQRVQFDGEPYFTNPTLLEFVAENPVRHDSVPPNIVDIARLILDAGAASGQPAIASTLELVCSGRVTREGGVQIGLVDLLCDYGADPNAPMVAALSHGEFEAVEALLKRGATVDLVAAAAMGRIALAQEQIGTAGPEDRHRALAMAAQHGHADMVALLLDAGEDPNRYNPPGSHAQSTPLHQAALAGHLEVVRLLVRRGARLDIRDRQHHATPLEWAEHGAHAEVVTYLREEANRQRS